MNKERVFMTSIKRRAIFQISRVLILYSFWLHFIHFSEYKHMNRLVKRLRKREDQELISNDTIQKFPAQLENIKYLIHL